MVRKKQKQCMTCLHLGCCMASGETVFVPKDKKGNCSNYLSSATTGTCLDTLRTQNADLRAQLADAQREIAELQWALSKASSTTEYNCRGWCPIKQQCKTGNTCYDTFLALAREAVKHGA